MTAHLWLQVEMDAIERELAAVTAERERMMSALSDEITARKEAVAALRQCRDALATFTEVFLGDHLADAAVKSADAILNK